MRHVTSSIICSIFILFSTIQFGYAQEHKETEAVRVVAQKYFNAWYNGNSQKMEQVIHPKLAKRGPLIRKNKEIELSDMSALELIQATEEGGGSSTPDSLKQKDITVLSITTDIASVKIDGDLLTEYLQLIKWKGEWKIINLLWEIKPKWRDDWNYS